MPAITDVDELQAMENDLAGDYWLANDIDASATSGWHGGAGFIPIGLGAPYFTGSFDGKHHTISDLFINRPGTNNIGLFGYTDGATIQDVRLTGADITSRNSGGILIGLANITTVSKSFAIGGVTGLNFVGSLIGTASGGSDVTECYAFGTAAGVGYIGSLIGACTSSNVTDCYARGAATGTGNYVGGLIGYLYNSTISNSFSTGVPTGVSYIGGLIGDNYNSTVTNSFWDTETSGMAVSDGGTGKTTDEMQEKATFTAADWDFLIIWFINGITNDGYPFHWALPPEPMPDAPRETVLVKDEITLKAIRNVEMAAGGRTYIGKDGKFNYRSRYARNV